MDLSKLSQLGNMISELGVNAAKQDKDKSKIDTKGELNLFTSGYEAIQNRAISEGADEMDLHTLEVRMKGEVADMLGVDFGQTAGVESVQNEKGEYGFSSEEISLENMMSLLSEEDGIDMDKLREYNKKPIMSMSEVDAVDRLTDAGFSEELTDILMEETPGVVRYITNSIKDGSKERIEKNIENNNRDDITDPSSYDLAMMMHAMREESLFS